MCGHNSHINNQCYGCKVVKSTGLVIIVDMVKRMRLNYGNYYRSNFMFSNLPQYIYAPVMC